ncbi:hypothetical protein ACHAXT_009327 [Thalassiosira profunda]
MVRGIHLGVAIAGLGGGAAAFGTTSCGPRPRSPRAHPSRSSVHVHQSSVSQDQEQTQQHQSEPTQHPHLALWESTLASSHNAYVHPSVALAIRPPSQGGTGIVATDDVPADTIAMCLPLEEVGMIDAASILDGYRESDGKDTVLDVLQEMWDKELVATKKEESQEGKRLAVLAGIIAHLQLTRYKDKTAWTSTAVKGGYALEQSQRLGLFLDGMPLLPQYADPKNERHPFPTHFLYWTDDEIQVLLQGTMGQTKAREVRAGIGLVVREWSASFLQEHSNGASQSQILDAIFSAFSAVLSRSFGDAAGRDLDGKGRMLVPLVDMLNHDGEKPNVSWTWNVGDGDEEKIAEGKGDIVVTTLREVKKGEELYKCYGWRPAWDIASSYGFVPELRRERWECAVIPLFPAALDLAPDAIPTPNAKAKEETTLDLLLESNYGPLVKAVLAAGSKDEIEEEKDDRPDKLDRLEVVSLFRPPPKSTGGEFPFPRRQPCVVVGTKIGAASGDADRSCHHRRSIEETLPAFRAAASAISQLRKNHSSDDASPIEASQMAMAAASLDKSVDWDAQALALIREGIADRMTTLVDDGKAAEAWLARQNDVNGADDQSREHRQFRAGVARDVREAELMVLDALRETTEHR